MDLVEKVFVAACIGGAALAATGGAIMYFAPKIDDAMEARGQSALKAKLGDALFARTYGNTDADDREFCKAGWHAWVGDLWARINGVLLGFWIMLSDWQARWRARIGHILGYAPLIANDLRFSLKRMATLIGSKADEELHEFAQHAASLDNHIAAFVAKEYRTASEWLTLIHLRKQRTELTGASPLLGVPTTALLGPGLPYVAGAFVALFAWGWFGWFPHAEHLTSKVNALCSTKDTRIVCKQLAESDARNEQLASAYNAAHTAAEKAQKDLSDFGVRQAAREKALDDVRTTAADQRAHAGDGDALARWLRARTPAANPASVTAYSLGAADDSGRLLPPAAAAAAAGRPLPAPEDH